ncbi:3763_t:CDS:2, partial [Ambispora leptoticha]
TRQVTNYTKEKKKALQILEETNILDKLGFKKYDNGPPRLGWLINMSGVKPQTGIDSYFRCTIYYYPYFFVQCQPGTEHT